MKAARHDRAEALAGAIILGEATDDERLEYRRHIATCPACLIAYGGEHELSRLGGVVTQARESEVWEPDVRTALLNRLSTPSKRFARYGLGFLGVCLLVSLIGHFVVGSGLAQIRPTLADPLVINLEGNKIVLERRSVRDAKSPTPAPRMVVVHNIVQLPRAAAPSVRTRTALAVRNQTLQRHVHEIALGQAPQPAAETSKAAASGDSIQAAIPVWRRGSVLARARFGSAEAVSAGSAARAEAITIAASYTVRDAQPEGGETAINPQPAQIAVLEGAEGTSAFEVMIDETGTPTKCVITKASGWPALDDAVCKAAMKVHYRPKTINGKPVPGVYRDAFTFRASQQE